MRLSHWDRDFGQEDEKHLMVIKVSAVFPASDWMEFPTVHIGHLKSLLYLIFNYSRLNV